MNLVYTSINSINFVTVQIMNNVKPTISLVIAVYQNEKAVTLTYEKIKKVFCDTLPHCQYEIVFVNDGSTDGSLAELKTLRANDNQVKIISFTRNFGQMAAMLAGFEHATGDAIINISADLQDPVELIPKMIEQWQSGNEVVICHREEREDKLSAKILSRVAYAILRIGVPKLPPGGFDVALMDRKVMDTLNNMDTRNRFFQGDLLWTGYQTSFIPYKRQERTIGKSQYTLWKKIKNFADGILDSSYIPIRFMSLCGIIVSLLGFFYMITIVISWLCGGTPFTGWAPIMVAILIVGGMIMFMLGIIGEYIWRIYDEVRKKPNYLVREKLW